MTQHTPCRRLWLVRGANLEHPADAFELSDDDLTSMLSGDDPVIPNIYAQPKAVDARAALAARLPAEHLARAQKAIFKRAKKSALWADGINDNSKTRRQIEQQLDADYGQTERGAFAPELFGNSVLDHNVLTLAVALACADVGLAMIDTHGLYADGRPSTKGSTKAARGAAWQSEATTDADDLICRWTGRGTYPPSKNGESYRYASVYQPRGVGLVIGEHTGLTMIDVDMPRGQAWLEAHDPEMNETEPLPYTTETITGSGGRHLLYRTSVPTFNTVSQIADQIDTRGQNGLSVTGGSWQAVDKDYYAFEENAAPWECAPVQMPEWLAQACTEASKKTQSVDADARTKGALKTKVQTASGSASARSHQVVGFEAHLDLIGDHAGGEGFNGPIYSAACSFFAEKRTDEDELVAALLHAIQNAEVKDGRDNIERYLDLAYLREQTASARAYIDEKRAEERATDETPPEFEPVCDWLDADRYRVRGAKIVKVDVKLGEPIEEGGDPETAEVETPLCAAFHLVGRTARGEEGFGVMIHYRNAFGVPVTLHVPAPLIFGDAGALVTFLAERGFWLAQRYQGRNMDVARLFESIEPSRRIKHLLKPGWQRDDTGEITAYVSGTGELISASGEANPGQIVPRLETGRGFENRSVAGTFDGSRDVFAAAMSRVDQNFYWPLTLFAGFAGPLVGLCSDRLPIGLFLSGRSSKGKTLGCHIAASIAGCPRFGESTFFSMNGTSNSRDFQALRANDCFMGLDDLAKAPSKSEVSQLFFRLNDGRVKERARAVGGGVSLAQSETFSNFVVMSSERNMKVEVEAAGGAWRKGMGVRFLDLDCGDGADAPDALLHRLEACYHHYGHALPAFIDFLFEDGIATAGERAADAAVDERVRRLDPESSLHKRAARVLALCWWAGDLAVEAGLVPASAGVVEAVIRRAWGVFLSSDEARTFDTGAGGDLIESLRDAVTRYWGNRIHVPSDIIERGTGEGLVGQGAALAWGDETMLYVPSKSFDTPEDWGLGAVKRSEIISALDEIGALEREVGSDRASWRTKPAGDILPQKVTHYRINLDKLFCGDDEKPVAVPEPRELPDNVIELREAS